MKRHLRLGKIRLRHKLGAKQRYQRKAAEEGARRQDQRDDAVFERPAKQALIKIRQSINHRLKQPHEFLEQAFRARLGRWVGPHRREHRVERERHKHRHQHRGHHGDAERIKKAPDDAAHKAHRQKHRNNRHRGRKHRNADFLRAFHRGGLVVLAHRCVAHDILAHHDGIVDQQADRERQRHQADHVDGDVGDIHKEKRRHDRNRQGQAGDHRRAPRIEEQEHDQDGQRRAFDHGAAHVLDTGADRRGRVANHIELHVCGEFTAHRQHGFLDAVGYLNRVLPLRLDDVERQHARAVLQREVVLLLLAVDHGGNFAQGDRLSTAARNDDAVEVLDRADLALDLHHLFALQRANAAGRQLLVLALDRVDDLIDAHVERLHLDGFEQHLHFTFDATDDGDGADAAHVLDAFLDDLIGQRGEVACAACAACAACHGRGAASR